MFNKINIKTLAIILLVLAAGIALLVLQEKRQGGRNFREHVVVLNPSEVSGILLKPQSQGHEEVRFLLEDGQWYLRQGDQKLPADSAKVSSLLAAFTNLKVQRLAATQTDKWSDFQVDDTSSTHIQIFGADRTLASLYIGRFGFNQSARTGLSYVRVDGEDEVYAVEGFLSMEVNQGMAHWLKQTLFEEVQDTTASPG